MSTTSNSNQTTSNPGILSKAREYIHETVKTDAIREQEKPVTEKISEAVPSSLDEAVNGAKGLVQAAYDDVTTKFQERLDEDRPAGEKVVVKDPEPKGLVGKTKDQVTNLREKIYDITKSEEEKKADEWNSKSLAEKMADMAPTFGTDEK